MGRETEVQVICTRWALDAGKPARSGRGLIKAAEWAPHSEEEGGQDPSRGPCCDLWLPPDRCVLMVSRRKQCLLPVTKSGCLAVKAPPSLVREHPATAIPNARCTRCRTLPPRTTRSSPIGDWSQGRAHLAITAPQPGPDRIMTFHVIAFDFRIEDGDWNWGRPKRGPVGVTPRPSRILDTFWKLGMLRWVLRDNFLRK